MKRVAYQGLDGSFSHMTAVRSFGKDCTFVGKATFREVFEELSLGRADFAMIPIENSIAGSIYENYDHLHLGDMTIIGEAFTKIEHCLLGSGSIEQIKKVLSHPKALEQCRKFFQEHPQIEAVVHFDTAGAARDVALAKDPTLAAIASSEAGAIYGLTVLKNNIEDDPHNTTRFVMIAKEKVLNKKANKCSLTFTISHEPKALLKILEALDGLNMTKIASRPLQGRPFEYVFYIDFEYKVLDEMLFENLKKRTQTLKILGFYEGAL